MNILTLNKRGSKLKDWCFKMPNIFILQPLGTSKTEKPRMINLLQENKKIESHRTNCTFGFLPTHKQTQKNQKNNFLVNAQTELQTIKRK